MIQQYINKLGPNPIVCDYVEVRQPIGKFYVFSMSHKDLIGITYTDFRRIEKEERGFEKYLGIQRPLSEPRKKEIGRYVNTYDATFPSSVIIGVDSFNNLSENLESPEAKDDGDIEKNLENINVVFDKDARKVYIRNAKNVAQVLDGQHRIAGLTLLKEENSPFDTVVTMFVGADVELQALIFSMINKTQTKVHKSLVYDLFALSTKRSPQKTCHEIAIAVNKNPNSPFKDKIKILGVADDPLQETITQSTFVESLLKYISKDPNGDRDFILRHTFKKLPLPEGKDKDALFLRAFFVKGEDEKIAVIMINYFLAIQGKWPTAWSGVNTGLVLNKSTGYLAAMRFLKNVYLHLGKDNEVPSVEDFSEIINRITLTDSEFNNTNFIPGAIGVRDLYQRFLKDSGIV